MLATTTNDRDDAGKEEVDVVRYYDSDFSFEEHAAYCKRTTTANNAIASSSSSGVTVTDDEIDAIGHAHDNMMPMSQSTAWDAFHARHSSGNFYKTRRYLLEAFPCIMDYLLGGDVRGDCDDIDEDGGALDEEDEEEEGEEEEETKERRGALGARDGPAHETRANDSRVVLEIGCGSGSSCLPIIQRYRDAISRGGGMRRRCASYANDTTGSCHGGGTSDETRHGGMARCRHRRRRTRGADRGIAVLLACDSSPVAVSTTRRLVVVDDDDDIYAGSTGGGCHDRTEEDDDANHRNHRRRLMAFEAFVADPSLTDDEETGVVVGTDVVDDYHDGTTFPSRVFSAYERAMSKIGGGEDEELGGGLGAERDIAFEGGRGRVVGVVLMIFVLSAVVPRRVRRFLDRVFEITNAGGRVCFRDYGLYDMPMLRFDPSASRGCADVTTVTDDNGYSDHVGDPVFVRGEGTIARFFSVDAVRSLFESVGFETLELRYCTVYNRNRKTGQEMKRVFVHGVFLKP